MLDKPSQHTNLPPWDIADLDNIEPEPEVKPKRKRSGCLKIMVEIVETALLAVVLFLAINAVSARIRVDGSSMEPSFHHNDYVIVNKLAYWFGDIERGDVIVFPFPQNPEEEFIKRVIGLPGDRIQILQGKIFLNDLMLTEPYIQSDELGEVPEIVVPPGTVYVIGDNRNNSSDSRKWGPLPMDAVLGQAVFVYWPLPAFGFIPEYKVDFNIQPPN